MEHEEKSVSEILAENFKRETPRFLLGVIGQDIDLYLWQFVSRTVVYLGLGLAAFWFLKS